MAKEKKMITQEGYDKLVEELKWREIEERERIKTDIATARSFGDLSENAEYDAARNAQAENEARITELKAMIENSVIIDESKVDFSTVGLHTSVKVYDIDAKVEKVFHIVSSNEIDPVKACISDHCPLGLALVGRKAAKEKKGGDIEVVIEGGKKKFDRKDLIAVDTPNGKTLQYVILDVFRTNKG